MVGITATRAFYGHRDHTSVLQLSGQVRFVAAEALRGMVDGMVSANDTDAVIVDLREVELIDSTGLGLLARVGRRSLTTTGRRAILVCANNDVAICLRSAGFDYLFTMVDEYPFDEQVTLSEVPLHTPDAPRGGRALGRVILDAHRDLASVSEDNRSAYAELILRLEADLNAKVAPE